MIGVDNSERNRAKALELGLVDRTASLAEAVAGADLVVLATPVDSIPLLAVKVLNQVDRQVVIDMGSTKQELCEVIAQHPRRGRFVATHPMWGTEYSGPRGGAYFRSGRRRLREHGPSGQELARDLGSDLHAEQV